MQYQTELAVRDYYLSTQRTSTIALAAVSNAIDSINHKPHREVICTFLARVIDCFDFDHASSISSAMQKLQCNLKDKECSQSHPTIQPVAGGGNTPHPVTSQPAKSAAAYPCPLNNTITKPMRPPTSYHIFLANVSSSSKALGVPKISLPMTIKSIWTMSLNATDTLSSLLTGALGLARKRSVSISSNMAR